MYATVVALPQIAFSVYTLASYLQNPTEVHLKAAYQLLNYLKREKCEITIDTKEITIFAMSDANWARCKDTRRSQGGYAFFTSPHGGTFCWKSKKQTCTALSSAESELVALCAAGQQACWILKMIKELTPKHPKDIPIFNDNVAASIISRNEGNLGRLKHIDIKYHYIQECTRAKKIKLPWINTKENTADALTKALPLPLHSKHRAYLTQGDNPIPKEVSSYFLREE